MTSSGTQNNTDKRILIMAGGTGGHIFPGLAVARELQKENWKVFWLGSFKGMEEDIINKTDIPLSLISVVGLRGNGLIGWLKAPLLLLNSVMSAISIIRKIKPHVVIGFGGFASGPGGLASYLLRIKLFIHEQNAVAGMTNRFLSKFANKVYLGFPNALGNECDQNIRVIGNPVRAEIKHIKKLDKNITSEINLLVLGGSRGAKIINQKLPKILDSIKTRKVNVFHQSGKGNKTDTINQYAKTSCKVEVVEFIENIGKRFAWADIVICRAGASSVAEIAAVGLPAIFIPFPYAVDDHQYFNARWLADKNAAVIIRENVLDSIESQKIINDLLNNENKLVDMGNQAKQVAYLNAAEEIANDCEKTIRSMFAKKNLKVA